MMESTKDSVPPIEEQKEFYNEFWHHRNRYLNNFEIVRLARILESCSQVLGDLRKYGTPRICDLGCGVGWLAAELAKFGSVTGVELSAEGVRIAKERWPEVTFVAADILDWRPDEKFDLVVSSEVFEHVPRGDKPRFVQTIESILRPGGYLILTTPNKRAKNIALSNDHNPQIVEDWVSQAELKRFFAQEFRPLRCEIFLPHFAYRGLYRYTGAPKLLRLLESAGLLQAYEGLLGSARVGLYQLMLARRNSKPVAET